MGAKYGYGFMDEAIEGKSVGDHGGGAPGDCSSLSKRQSARRAEPSFLPSAFCLSINPSNQPLG